MALPPFQTFLDRYAAELLRFLVAMAGPDEAEDCFQETCIAALRAYPRLAEDSDLRAWAFTIARRKAIDAGRARGRRPAPVAEGGDGVAARRAGGVHEAEEPFHAPGAAEKAVHPRGPVEKSVHAPGAADDAHAWAPLGALPPKQRAAVFLRVAVELPHREVARILECSEEAARRSAHEGLKRLREEMS